MATPSPKERAGDTLVSSVSLTKEFKDICRKYAISPTWAVRKGIAIELYEKGVLKYQSNLNKLRYAEIQEFLQTLSALEEAKESLQEKKGEIRALIKGITSLTLALEKALKLMEENDAL